MSLSSVATYQRQSVSRFHANVYAPFTSLPLMRPNAETSRSSGRMPDIQSDDFWHSLQMDGSRENVFESAGRVSDSARTGMVLGPTGKHGFKL